MLCSVPFPKPCKDVVSLINAVIGSAFTEYEDNTLNQDMQKDNDHMLDNLKFEETKVDEIIEIEKVVPSLIVMLLTLRENPR